MKHYFLVTIVITVSLISTIATAQSIGSFNSVQPSAQTQSLVIPSTHTFQRIIQSGNALTAGGTLGANLDFTGYVPIGGSSTNGYLSISSESTPAECAVLSINYNAVSQLWNTTSSGKVNFPVSEIGNVARFCSGTVTPDNTIMVCEESITAGDANGDGYEDLGWIIEIDPATRTVKNQDGIGGGDKLWAAGRQSHENASIKSDESIIYWGADANPTGYMYKFIPTSAGNYTDGTLYVLTTTSSLGTGTWVQVPNTTQSERNNTVANSTSLGAYNFNGIEDVEQGPDGKIYFAAKGPGVIYRFNDNGTTVSNLEVFVASNNYDVDGAGPYAPEAWGIGNDNLAFDGDGNLWVLQDGSRNHIWVVGPGHTAVSPAVRLFATTPSGSEPTGITFSPDYKFLFISFQHPSTSNTASQLDAAGTTVVFNTHTTIVIARKEFLGAPLCDAPTTLNSTGITQTTATLSWAAVSGAVHYSVDYKANSSTTWINAATNTTSTSLNLTGLSSNTIYDWRVIANCTASSSSYSTAQFTTLTSSTCPGPYDISTNGTISGAATIPLNTDIKGTISPSGDQDHYRLTFSLGGPITVTLSTLPANYDLRLLNSGGTVLATSANKNTTSESINYTVTPGTYYIRVYPKGNVNSSSCYTLHVASAGASLTGNNLESRSNSIQIFPNPAKDRLTITLPVYEYSKLKIANLIGQTIYSQPINNSSTQIMDISNLMTGSYILILQNDKEIKAVKFIKE